MTSTSRQTHREDVTTCLHALLATIPECRGVPSFDDTIEPKNREQWEALCRAVNGGQSLDSLDSFDQASVREEASFLLGVAATLRAVSEARALLTGTLGSNKVCV